MPDPRVTTPTRPHSDDAFYLPADVPSPVPPEDVGRYLRGLFELNSELAERFRREKVKLPVDVVAQAATDSSGNATFPIYQAGAGFYCSVNRLALESDGYTPASAFTGGAVIIAVSQTPNSAAQGQMVDFLPTVAGGQLFPAIGQYANGGSPDDVTGILLRSQDFLVCKISAGPVSKTITVHMTGLLWGQES